MSMFEMFGVYFAEDGIDEGNVTAVNPDDPEELPANVVTDAEIDALIDFYDAQEAALIASETAELVEGEDDNNFYYRGFIIPKNTFHSAVCAADNAEVKCYCSPEKSTFCADCDVYREMSDWAWRPSLDIGGGFEAAISDSTADKQPITPPKPQQPVAGSLQPGAPKPNQNAKPYVTPAVIEPRCYCATTSKVHYDHCKVFPGKPMGECKCAKTLTKHALACKAKPGQDMPKTYSTGTTSTYVAKDRHYGEKFEIAGITMYISSMNNTRKEGEFVPDFGLYFDWGWHPYWRNEHIAWPDYNIPTDFTIALEQIVSAIERSQNGEKVEVGCIGAHGRTGTALAVMGVIGGMKPKEAIDYVRKEHCTHAIESELQEWWVFWAYGTLNDLPIPKQPEKKSYKGTTGTQDGGQPCQETAHWTMWVAGHKKCTAKTVCQFWAQDDKKFNEGKAPTGKTWVEPSKTPPPAAPVTTSQGDLYTYKTIRGWWVPKPTGKGVKQHINDDKKTCVCDVCRYLDAGFEAFLEPVSIADSKKYKAMLAVHEKLADQRIAARAAIANGVVEAEVKDGQWVKVAMATGEILETEISDDFKPKPPTETPKNLKHGQRRGEYVWLDGEGWVWEGLCKVDVTVDKNVLPFRKKNKKDRKKERQEAARAARNR